MTIYVELVFVINFFADLFIVTTTTVLLKLPQSNARSIFSALFGATLASFLPFLWKYTALIQIMCLLLYPFLIRKCKSMNAYVTTLCVFAVVTLFLGGMMYGIKLLLKGTVEENGITLIVTLFCISALCMLWMMTTLSKKLVRDVSRNRFLYKVAITDGRKEKFFYAFYDSGNRVYANNGEPVTIVCYDVYTMFGGEEETLYVSTVNGIKAMKAKEVKIRIYFEDCDNRIYRTKIASSPEMIVRENIILHGDMLGGQYATLF